MRPGFSVRCWGARGSIPSPGPYTAGYGGNTPCIEVFTADGRRLVFDAGTGIRPLGRSLGAATAPLELFLTHFHWDHIQGLPFFEPLFDPAATVRIHGPREGGTDLRRMLERQMSRVYFPVPAERLAANLEFRHLGRGTWRDGDTEVAWLRVRHPTRTVGYRVSAPGAAMAYVPDNELGGGAPSGRGSGSRKRLLGFVRGVDLLIHDATYTAAEYSARCGWGHSTVDQAIRLAEDAAVRTLWLFHHAPERTDRELDAIVAAARDELARRGSPLRLEAAREGVELRIRPAERPSAAG